MAERPHSESAAMKFEVRSSWKKARSSVLTLPHATVLTPVFMPVGTQGTIKGLTCEQIEKCGCNMILGNTFHLGLRPGPDVLNRMGGLHKFMGWKNGILTDSGGFQMVSLLSLAEITEEGVLFQSPHDGRMKLLTPEESMAIQNSIGADIMMVLDDVVHVSTRGPRVRVAMERTIRWSDRCKKAHQRPLEQNLFAIVQGGLDADLRRECLSALISRDFPGYAIGGLSGGESKEEFWRTVDLCTDYLPPNKPRYLMGVGYPVDLVMCVALGVDMFDCVYPTRTARFGTAMTSSGNLILRNAPYATDFGPIDRECTCPVCTNSAYTRAYLHTIAGRESVGCALLSIHNISFQMQLMAKVRRAIEEGSFEGFVRDFMRRYHGDSPIPEWCNHVMEKVGISPL